MTGHERRSSPLIKRNLFAGVSTLWPFGGNTLRSQLDMLLAHTFLREENEVDYRIGWVFL